jgi:hypothetical protein
VRIERKFPNFPSTQKPMNPQMSFLQSVSAGEAAEIPELKKQYLACLASVEDSATGLREIVERLVGLGIGRKELIQWATDAGYQGSYARSVLSRILCELGLRTRKRGAGRPVAPESVLITAQNRERYGKKATRFLFGAHRLSRAQDEAESESAQSRARSKFLSNFR